MQPASQVERPWIPHEQPGWPREESNLRTRIRSPPLYPLSYGALDECSPVVPSGFRGRLEVDLGGLALPQLAASLGLGVDLGAQEQR